MKQLQPINPEEIEAIRQQYAEKIAQADRVLGPVLEVERDSLIAQTIARQRREAIDKGGPLAEQLKAENEEVRREVAAEMEKFADKLNKQCPKCGEVVPYGKFCAACGFRFDGTENILPKDPVNFAL